VEWKGWRINPQVCYDLRFPVFCRNRYNVERPQQLDFDLQIFVANWPSARAYAWKTLLRARAIENLCFVAAVNRVGVDGNQLHYAGDSAVLDFLGQPQVESANANRWSPPPSRPRRWPHTARVSRRCSMPMPSTWTSRPERRPERCRTSARACIQRARARC
jgi:hypothetical protein